MGGWKEKETTESERGQRGKAFGTGVYVMRKYVNICRDGGILGSMGEGF